MSRLIVVIGLTSPGPSAAARPVYVGRSGSAAEAAMKSSTAPCFEIFRNVTSVRKNNPNAAANQAKEDEAKAAAQAEADAKAKAEADEADTNATKGKKRT